MIMTVFITVMVILVGIPVSAKTTLEPQQSECLEIAYEEGEKIELYGDTWGQTVASIAYQESHCNRSKFQTEGVVVGDRNSKGKPKSLGPMQVQVPTARHVGRVFPHLFTERYGDRRPTDEELTIDLLTDVRFNIRVGVHYYAWLLEYRKGSWHDAVLSYNRGTGYNLRDINDYVRLVRKWRKTVVIPHLKRVGVL